MRRSAGGVFCKVTNAAMRSATCATRSGSGRLTCRRAAERLVLLCRLLERDRTGHDAPVEFRQHDMHREIGRREPALPGGPGVAAGRRQRRPGRPAGRVRSNSVSAPGAAPAEKAVVVSSRDAFKLFETSVASARAAGSFRLLTKTGTATMPRSDSTSRKRIDWRDIAGEQHRAIEEERHDRLARRHRLGKETAFDDADPRRIEASARRCCRRFDRQRFSREARHAGAEPPRMLRGPTLAETSEQRVIIGIGYGRQEASRSSRSRHSPGSNASAIPFWRAISANASQPYDHQS